MKITKSTILLFISVITVNNLIAQKSIDSLLIKLQDICENEDIPGAMISIVTADTILYSGGIGYANSQSKEPITAQHLFRLGSISKSITALGFVKLADKNKIQLNAHLNKVDDKLNIKNKWQDKSPITIEQILEHTAGFDDVHGHANYPVNNVDLLSSQEMVNAHKKSLYARWKPGVRMAYSNPGYVLAGHLIEKVTNSSYNQFLKEEILTPLEMEKSGFYFKDNPDMILATGHRKEGGKLSTINFKSVQGGAASDFCSNAEEMAKLLQFCLRKKLPSKNELFEEKWFHRIENPKTTIAARKGFVGGYGLGNMNIWTNNYLFHGHDGSIDGFSSIYLYSREADLGLAVSMNVQGNIWDITDEILNFYLGPNNFVLADVDPINKEIQTKYSGFYNFKSPRNQLMYFIQKMMSGHTIEFDNNKLLVKDFGGIIRDTLYHKGNNIFYRKNEGVPFVMLFENDDKKPVMWLGGEYAEIENRKIRVTINYLIIVALITSIQYFFVGFIWWLTQLFKKDKKPKMSRFILWITSAFLVLTPVIFIATVELYDRPENVNLGSIALFISSILFFICSILSIVQSFRLKNEKAIFRWYYRITSLSLFILGLWFLSNKIIGFRLWAY